MNNRVWFYELDGGGAKMGKKLRDQEYMGTLSQIYLNDEFAAVMAGNKIHLHFIDNADNPEVGCACSFPSLCFYLSLVISLSLSHRPPTPTPAPAPPLPPRSPPIHALRRGRFPRTTRAESRAWR